ncbi:elongation of very long chain fatty acids protein 3 [Ornithorhynchus anatinus]|nr:elongation of very long chain fatty acids protein 3 [Ornithorhynchus anatinus]
MNGSGEALRLLQAYDFEHQLDLRPWIVDYWRTSFPMVVVYLLLIFMGQRVMKGRSGYNLRLPLMLWSLSLAIFSILGMVRTWGFMKAVLLWGGLKQSVCFSRFHNDPVIRFWSFLFAASKVIELGDTAFIVLRKQRLLFLHWFHHSTVLIYTWYAYKDSVAGGGWFMTMNYGVHAFMYSYYTARAAGLRVPRPCAMLITVLQILQMAGGMTVNGLNWFWLQDRNCYTSQDQLFWASSMYLAYLALFLHFFHQAYFRGRAGKTKGE